MTTALDLIKSSLRLIRVIDAADTPAAVDSNIGLFTLNALLGQWAAQPNTIYQSTEITKALTIGDGEYTVGTGLDIPYNITRVDRAYIRDSSGTDLPLQIITDAEYQDISQKSQQGQPLFLVYDRGSSIKLWPLPVAVYTLRLTVLVPFTTLALGDTLVYPVEYTDALRFALARRLAPEYGSTWTPELQDQYTEAMSVMKAMNLSQTLKPATFDMPVTGNRDGCFRRMNFPS